MIKASRGWPNFGFLWLSLAIILLHALLPVGSPLIRSSGSAFNGFTYEVALGPSRASIPEREKRQREPGFVAGDPPRGGAAAIWLQSELRSGLASASAASLPPANAVLGRPTSGPARSFHARGPPLPNG